MAPLEQLVHELDARDRIGRLIADFCHGMDKRDRALFGSLWAEDAEWRPSPNYPWCHGRAAILAAMDAIWEATGTTHHWVTNVAIDVHGDEATAMSDVVARVCDAEGRAAYSALTYDDRFALRDGNWLWVRRIARNQHVLAAGGAEGDGNDPR